MKRTRIFTLFLCLALILTSLSVPVEVSAAGKKATQSITLNVKSKQTMYVGMSKKVKVKSVTPKGSSKKVTYKSSDSSVAKVSKSGTIKALKPGTATITVTSASNTDVSKKVKITVKNLVKNETYNKMVIALDKKKKTKKLSFTSKVKASNLSLSSSKKKVAEVSNKGVVTGKKVGKAKITIKGKTGSVKGAKQVLTVYVAKKSVKTVALNLETVTLNPTETTKLKTTVTPKNAANVAVYESSDENIATVTQSGKVTAVAPGTATITAITVDGNKKATCTVTVNGDSLSNNQEQKPGDADVSQNTVVSGYTSGDTDADKPGDADTDKPGDTDTDKPSDTETDNPGDTETDNPGDTDTDNPGDTETDKPGDTETDKPADTETDKPGDTETDNPGDTETDQPGDTETDQPGDTETDQPGDTETDQPGDTETDQPGDTETDQPGDTETDQPGDTDTGTSVTPDPVIPSITPLPETSVSFNSVAQMKTADLKEGDIVRTEGYYEAGDNGAATYEIMTYETWYEQLPEDIKFVRPESTLIETPVDEYGNHTLDNGLVAKLYGNSYTPEQWGAKDGSNLMPFIHMFAQVKTGRIDFQENKTYELELIANDNPYRWYMCGALLGGQYFYKPIMGNVQDLVLDGHNCTITIPDGKFGDSGMGILNFTRNIVNLEIKNFTIDGKGHTMFWENKNSNHLIFYAPGSTNGTIDYEEAKVENWQIHDNTFDNAGAMYSKSGDYGGDCILVINPDALNGLYINKNNFYNWGRWVFAIDLGGEGERLYNVTFNENTCIGANGYLEEDEDGNYKYLNEAPEMVGSVDTWRWRALGLIDFEAKKCFTHLEMKNNYILGTAGWAFNGCSRVSEDIQIENNYWNHVGGGYPYRFEFYSGMAKDIVFRNNEMLGTGGCRLGIFTHNATIENNVFNGAFRTFGLAGDIVFKGNRKTGTISTLWSHESNVFYDEYLSYEDVKNDVGVNIVYKDNDGYFSGTFTDMTDINKLSYMNFDVDTDTHEIYKMGVTAFGTNLKINPQSFTSVPQDMYAHGAEITKPFTSQNGIASIVKVKAGQTVATNMQEGYGVVGGYFFKKLTGIEDFAKYNNYNWGAYASQNNFTKVELVCTEDGYLPGTCEYGFRYNGTHISYVLDGDLTLQQYAYVYTDENLYYTPTGGKLTQAPTHTEGSVLDGETELIYIGKVAKVKVVAE